MPFHPKPATCANNVDPLDHVRLVRYWAAKCGANPPIEDSEQYADGWLGLLIACRHYDPTRISPKTGKTVKFATYATWWIRQQILKPHQAKLAARRAGKLLAIRSALPFSQFRGEDEAEFDPTRSRDDPVEGTERRETGEWCNHLLRRLNERQRAMVVLHCCLGFTLEQVGAKFGVTRERVRQIVTKSLKKLRTLAIQ